MILASSLQYRESESERAIVEILEDPNARDTFLKDREGYLSRFNLSSSAKSTPGQSHLNSPIQNALEIGVVPTSFESLGMNAHPRRFLLS